MVVCWPKKLLILVFLMMISGASSAKKYAVLISAGKATADDAHENCEYWYDLLLLYTALIDNGYDYDDIYVLYGDGTDFQSAHSCYQNPYPQSVTDLPNYRSIIDSLFATLGNTISQQDDLFIWWFGHGGKRWHPAGGWHLKLLIENTGEELWDVDLAGYFNQAGNYRQRVLMFMTCASGGILDDFYGPRNIVMASAGFSQTAVSRIICDTYHAEFNYFQTAALHWETPCFLCGGVQPDNNQDARISISEGFNFTAAGMQVSTPEIADADGVASFSFLGGTRISYAADWNLVGLPVRCPDPGYQFIFPGGIAGTLFGFNQIYSQEDSLKPGRGYWLRCSTGGSNIIAGQSVDSLILPLQTGWNLISGPSAFYPAANISDPGNILIPGTLLGYSGGYSPADTLFPGKGYWIRASASGTIYLQPSGEPAATQFKQHEGPELSPELPQLKISDAAGAQQILYFFEEELDSLQKLSFSLPPLPPGNAFDVRFAGGYYSHHLGSAVIRLQTSHFPIRIVPTRFAGMDGRRFYLREILSDGQIGQYELHDGKEVVLSSRNLNFLRVDDHSTENHPAGLLFNYPNPFNSVTNIHFFVASPQKVRIAIYDGLGRRVKVLSNQSHNSGYDNIEWNGRNEENETVASGVYFCRLSTRSITSHLRILYLR